MLRGGEKKGRCGRRGKGKERQRVRFLGGTWGESADETQKEIREPALFQGKSALGIRRRAASIVERKKEKN